MADFDSKGSGFWGAVAASIWLGITLLRYKISKDLAPIKGLETKGEQMEKVGIKETKEVLDGLNVVVKEIVKIAKDGIQIKDAVQVAEDIAMNPEFKTKLAAMIDNIKLVPEEIKDLDFSEGVELAQFEYEGVKSVIEALKN